MDVVSHKWCLLRRNVLTNGVLGGAQNIGKKKEKDKEKEAKKASSSKTGGFRGLKGIM